MSQEPNRPAPRRPERRKKKKSRRKKTEQVQSVHPEPSASLKVPANNTPEDSATITKNASLNSGCSDTRTSLVQNIESWQNDVKSRNPPSDTMHALTPPARPAGSKKDSVPMSPRKSALLRQKQPSAIPDFVSEVNEKRKKRVVVEPEDSRYPMLLASQNMDGKAQLFSAPDSQIVVYHEQLHQRSQTSGTLLAHGEFDIFQLHNGDVTYLACGRSFVYPLLPKLKILQTSRTEFVLPLVNPERYWKIHVSGTDVQLRDLTQVLKRVVNYTNLVEKSPLPDNLPSEISGELENAATSAHYTPYFDDIPESPPSVPVSPQAAFGEVAAFGDVPPFELDESGSFGNRNDQFQNYSLGIRNDNHFRGKNDPRYENCPTKRDHLDQRVFESPSPFPGNQAPPSLSSAMATFSLKSKQSSTQVTNVANLKHAVHTNPFFRSKPAERRKSASSSSSMDSLLDEYEENISTTRSIQHLSRPGSRGTSYVSTRSRNAPSFHHQGGYAYGAHSHVPAHLINGTQLHANMPRFADDFPSTSLSQYERNRQNSVGGRSHKSSVSELYSSVSNWMEPGPKLAKSKSIQSLATKKSFSRPYAQSSNLNDTYREIYRSITSHDLSRVVEGAPKPTQNPPEEKRSKGDGLSSAQVYKLLSERDEQKPTGIRRFFGW